MLQKHPVTYFETIEDNSQFKKQIIYSLYQAKECTIKKMHNNIMNSIKL